MQANEKHSAVETPAAFCRLNAICGSAAQIGGELAELPCDESSPAVLEGIVQRLQEAKDGKCPNCGMILHRATGIRQALICPKCEGLFSACESEHARWVVSERGMAMFVARRIAHGWIQPVGEVFHLGEKNKRDIYFAVKPTSQFFSMHDNKNVVLVVGNCKAKIRIPKGWLGQVVLFSELFHYHDGKNELHITENICNRILPLAGAGLRRGKNRVIHERRDEWLRFIVWLLSKPYNPKDFFKGVIRWSVVCAWFKRNRTGAPTSEKTYKRDYCSFRTYHGKPGECDYRESAIILLLKQAADPKFDRRREAAEATSELLLQLKLGADKAGHAIEISSEWQYTGDKRGTRTLVAVSNAPAPGDGMAF